LQHAAQPFGEMKYSTDGKDMTSVSVDQTNATSITFVLIQKASHVETQFVFEMYAGKH
jgi:hypothetical protein